MWTDTAKYIRRSLDLLNSIDSTAFTMISGAPGIGKTLVLKGFCREVGARYLQVAKSEGTPKDFASAFFAGYMGGRPAFRSVSEARELIQEYLGAGKILAVDEAQYLRQSNRGNGLRDEVFEWLRDASEKGRFKIVFLR